MCGTLLVLTQKINLLLQIPNFHLRLVSSGFGVKSTVLVSVLVVLNSPSL